MAKKHTENRTEVIAKSDNLIPVRDIESMIFTLRGVQVMLDRDLAFLYGVETRALNQAVKRNISRFPEDFMFQLTMEEANASRSQFVTLNINPASSKSQNVTLNTARGQNIKYRPYVFTENGVAMLSSVLRTQTAIEVKPTPFRRWGNES